MWRALLGCVDYSVGSIISLVVVIVGVDVVVYGTF